jgi:hypothetical protein
MKTSPRNVTIITLALLALTWPSVKVNSTEETEAEEFSGEGDSAAREAFRRQLLQDENGQIPQTRGVTRMNKRERCNFFPKLGTIFNMSMG